MLLVACSGGDNNSTVGAATPPNVAATDATGTTSVPTDEPILHVYNWADYIGTNPTADCA